MNDTRQPAGTEAVERLGEFMACHQRLAVLTGAGVSTDSGIPDYRDATGAWKSAPPMQHQQFMTSHAARQRYWARALAGFRTLHCARPSEAHRALARLEKAGVVSGLVTQNVDGLHQKAGSRQVIDLHGRAEQVRCMGCGALRMRHDLHAELAERNPRWRDMKAEVRPDGDADLVTDFSDFEVPGCRRCHQGIWKPDVVFFGDSVPQERVARARAMIEEAEALLVAGTSLMVYSGYRFVRQAASAGKPIVCLNLGRTRGDALYSLKLEAPVGQVLAAVAAIFKGEARAAG